jgi:isocitrate dehydrogenase
LLDNDRAHDREILGQIRAHLAGLNYKEGEDFIVKSPDEGIVEIHDFMRHNSKRRLVVGTGNVLRDYLTDWTPVLEAGTANMLTSQIGPNLHETGAGGTAPDLMQDALDGKPFKWGGVGEYLATAEALRGIEAHGNQRAGVVARRLDQAIKYLLNEEGSLPKIDTRYQQGRLAQLWAESLATQSEDTELAQHFGPIAAKLAEIVPEMKKDFLALADLPPAAANDHGVRYGLSQRPDLRRLIMASRLREAISTLAAA